MQGLKDCRDTMSGLLPIALHASLSYDITQKIRKTKPFYTLSWPHFMEIFTKSLSGLSQEGNDKYGGSLWKNGTEQEQKFAQNEIISRLNHGLVQEAFKYEYIQFNLNSA